MAAINARGAPFEAVFLLEDLHGEKSKILKSPSPKPVCRGELLLPIPKIKLVQRRDGKPAHNYQIDGDPAVTVFCTEDDVAPLDERGYNLLAGVKSRENRFGVFQMDRVGWGSRLRCGDFVYATLPSKSALPNQRVVSRIKFIGPLPNEWGVLFGVEIMDPDYRQHGSSNGSFGELQFFQCEENAGLFVSLDRLSPMDLKYPLQNLRPSTDVRKHQMVNQSRAQGGQPSQPDNRQQRHQNSSPVPSKLQFEIDDRVVVYNSKGQGIHGSVRWTGNLRYLGSKDLPAVGIETDVAVQSKEFAGALIGLAQLFKCKDSRHGKLVMPESMVVLEREESSRQDQHKPLKTESSGLAEDIEKAKKTREMKYIQAKQSLTQYTNQALKLLETTLNQQQDEYDTQLTQLQQDNLKKEESLAQLQRQLSEAKAENRSLLDAKQTLERELKAEKDSSALVQRQLSVSKAEHSSLLGTHQLLQEDLTRDKESLSKYKQQLSEAKAEVASLQSAQEESVAFGLEPWKVPRDRVQLGRDIGVGGWGVVYEGKLTVAVKKFHTKILSENNVLRLKREMRMLALVRHPNLLQFIAAVFDDGGDYRRKPPYIITELLDDSLRSTYEDQALPKSSLLSIFQDAARALDYLHRRYEPIIHRDVSSANVLLKQLSDDKWIAKLSDLGSANLAKEAYTMNEGARVYCAPEAFTFDTDARSTGTLTPAVDIYSYGIMLCEVATRTFPGKDEYPKMLDRLKREWPLLHQLVLSCTKHSPEHRPSMATVLSQLEGFPPQH